MAPKENFIVTLEETKFLEDMDKYYNGYRVPSARAWWWDYRRAGAYFVTINVIHKIHHFGKIQNGIMCLNAIGTIAYHEWYNTPRLRPDMNITLGAFIVMPDHIHGIIIIGENRYNEGNDANGTRDLDKERNLGKDALQCVSTEDDPYDGNDSHTRDIGNDRDLGKDALQCVSTEDDHHNGDGHHTDETSMNTFGPQSKNLSAIIRGYKGTVTKQSRLINPDFGWQERFYDRIIRDQRALRNITEYIERNPKVWTEKRERRGQ